mgnify:CR=1 FL=1
MCNIFSWQPCRHTRNYCAKVDFGFLDLISIVLIMLIEPKKPEVIYFFNCFIVRTRTFFDWAASYWIFIALLVPYAYGNSKSYHAVTYWYITAKDSWGTSGIWSGKSFLWTKSYYGSHKWQWSVRLGKNWFRLVRKLLRLLLERIMTIVIYPGCRSLIKLSSDAAKQMPQSCLLLYYFLVNTLSLLTNQRDSE